MTREVRKEKSEEGCSRGEAVHRRRNHKIETEMHEE